jgi:hypothetical protein
VTPQRKSLVAMFLFLLPFTAGAMNADLYVVRAQAFAAVQRFGQCSSGEVSWNPLFTLGNGFGIRGNIGGTVLKGFPDKFVAAEFEARLSYAILKSLSVETGGGAQTWFQKAGGASPMFSAAVSWMFFKKLPWLRAGITAGYSVFLPKDNLTHEPRLGVMLAFGKQGG